MRARPDRPREHDEAARARRAAATSACRAGHEQEAAPTRPSATDEHRRSSRPGERGARPHAQSGSSAERVRLGGLADEAVERERRRRAATGRDRRRRRAATRGRGAPTLDPRASSGDESSGARKKRLRSCDPVGGESRRERARRRASTPRSARASRRGAPAAARASRARAREQHDERGDRDDAEVEVSSSTCQSQKRSTLADVVAALADDAVGAEQVGERAGRARPARRRRAAPQPTEHA